MRQALPEGHGPQVCYQSLGSLSSDHAQGTGEAEGQVGQGVGRITGMGSGGICGDGENEVELLILNKLREGSSSNFNSNTKREGDFAGQPVIKISPSSLGGASLIPCQGARILHASQPHKPTHKQKPEHKQQKQHCNKFNKDFKDGPHQTKQSKKRG